MVSVLGGLAASVVCKRVEARPMVRTKLRPPPSGIGLGAKLWWRRYYKGPFSDWSKRPSTGPGPPASNGLPGPDQVMNSTLVSENAAAGSRSASSWRRAEETVGPSRAPSGTKPKGTRARSPAETGCPRDKQENEGQGVERDLEKEW